MLNTNLSINIFNGIVSLYETNYLKYFLQ